MMKAADEQFLEILHQIAASKMVTFDIASVVNSKVFEDTDSTAGLIIIADDGRYFAQFKNDLYLFDGRCLWEISSQNRQAAKRCPEEGEKFTNRLSFLKSLESHFRISPIHRNKEYQLFSKNKDDANLPDSLIVFIDSAGSKLSRIEYYDLNGDLNRVYILSQKISDTADSKFFEVTLPDSMEVIILP